MGAALRLAQVHRPGAGQVAVGQDVLLLGRVAVDQVAGRPVGVGGDLRPAAVLGHVGQQAAALEDVERGWPATG